MDDLSVFLWTEKIHVTHTCYPWLHLIHIFLLNRPRKPVSLSLLSSEWNFTTTKHRAFPSSTKNKNKKGVKQKFILFNYINPYTILSWQKIVSVNQLTFCEYTYLGCLKLQTNIPPSLSKLMLPLLSPQRKATTNRREKDGTWVAYAYIAARATHMENNCLHVLLICNDLKIRSAIKSAEKGKEKRKKEEEEEIASIHTCVSTIARTNEEKQQNQTNPPIWLKNWNWRTENR